LLRRLVILELDAGAVFKTVRIFRRKERDDCNQNEQTILIDNLAGVPLQACICKILFAFESRVNFYHGDNLVRVPAA